MNRYSLRHGTLAEKRKESAFEEVRTLIFPKLTAKDELFTCTDEHGLHAGQQKICLKEQDGGMSCIPRSFFGEFEITYIIDWSGQFPQMPLVDDITEEHLRQWQITLEELHRTAMENLSKNKIHIRYVMKNHVPWDDVLVDSAPGTTICQLSFDCGRLESCALNILLFGKQLCEIERMLERPFYLILCEPFPLLIPYPTLGRELDFDRICSAISRSSYAPDSLVHREVYAFEHGRLKKTGIRIRS